MESQKSTLQPVDCKSSTFTTVPLGQADYCVVAYYAPAPNRWGHKAMLLSDVSLSDVCLSVAYIGCNSRTERPRKTKIGTEVAHVTRDSDTTFKVKGQGHQAALVGCTGRPIWTYSNGQSFHMRT